MGPRAQQRLIYSRAERLTDAAVHVTGVIAALAAVPVLLTLSAFWAGDRATVIAAAVYGGSLLAMLSCSAIYHLTPMPNWKEALRRADQSAIYLKIAGTYTAFAVLSGIQAFPLLTGMWIAAAVGAGLIIFSPGRRPRTSLALYLGMSWMGAIVGGPMFDALNPTAYALIVAGGSLYTIGVIFYLWHRLPFHNTIWHVFVLAATCILYAAVVAELWTRAPVIL